MSKQQSPTKDATYVFAAALIIFIIARSIGIFSNIQWP